MKKILLTTLLMVLGCAAVQASMVIIDYQGETVVRPQSVERNLIINSDDGGVYNIAVRPLEDAMRSVDGNVTIPLSNLYINNTREDVYFRQQIWKQGRLLRLQHLICSLLFLLFRKSVCIMKFQE